MATKPAQSSKTAVASKTTPSSPADKPSKKTAVKTAVAVSKPVAAKPQKPAATAQAAPEKKTAKPTALSKPVKPVVAAKQVKQITETKASVVQAVKPKWSEIKEILLQMKDDTLREINKTLKNGADTVLIGEPSGDIYDQASSERDRELGLLLGDREREKVHAIDEALLRIDEEEYGVCEECEEDIPLGRLKAMPFTRHCVKCKSDLEKFQAQTKRFEEERAYREIPLGSEEEDG